jgi:E3 ubiquitin-protein ligase BRE1
VESDGSDAAAAAAAQDEAFEEAFPAEQRVGMLRFKARALFARLQERARELGAVREAHRTESERAQRAHSALQSLAGEWTHFERSLSAALQQLELHLDGGAGALGKLGEAAPAPALIEELMTRQATIKLRRENGAECKDAAEDGEAASNAASGGGGGGGGGGGADGVGGAGAAAGEAGSGKVKDEHARGAESDQLTRWLSDRRRATEASLQQLLEALERARRAERTRSQQLLAVAADRALASENERLAGLNAALVKRNDELHAAQTRLEAQLAAARAEQVELRVSVEDLRARLAESTEQLRQTQRKLDRALLRGGGGAGGGAGGAGSSGSAVLRPELTGAPLPSPPLAAAPAALAAGASVSASASAASFALPALSTPPPSLSASVSDAAAPLSSAPTAATLAASVAAAAAASAATGAGPASSPSPAPSPASLQSPPPDPALALVALQRSASEWEALRSELEELRLLAEARLEEANRQREERVALAAQLEERSRSAPTAADSSALRAAHGRVAALERERRELADRVEAAQARVGDLERELKGLADAGAAAMSRLQAAAQADVERLSQQRAQLQRERDELQARLDLASGSDRGLQRDGVVEDLRKLTASQAQQLTRARESLRELMAKLAQETREPLASLQHKLRVTAYLRAADRRRFDDAERELRVAMEALKSPVKDVRDLQEARSSERRLEEECKTLRERLAAAERERGATADAPWGASETEKLRAEAEAQRAEADVQRELAETLAAELGDLGKSFDELQEQCTRLTAKASEVEDLKSRVIAERVRSHQAQAAARAEQDALNRRLAAAVDASKAQHAHAQALHAQLTELTRVAEGREERAASAEQTAEKLRAAMQERLLVQAELEEQRKLLRQELDDAKSRLEAATRRAEIAESKLRENQYVRRGMAATAASSAASSSSGAETELRHLKKMLRCAVCSDRTKDVVMKRCFHSFCRQCIEERLAARLRKCPLCNNQFGKDDVMPLYLS